MSCTIYCACTAGDGCCNPFTSRDNDDEEDEQEIDEDDSDEQEGEEA